MSDELPPLSSDLRALLDAGKTDAPRAASKAAARAALGLPAPSVVAAAPSPSPAPAAPVASVSSGVGAFVVKAVVVLGLAGGAYTAGVRVGTERTKLEYEAVPPKTVIVEVPVKVEVPVPAPVVVEAVDAGVPVPVVKKRPVDDVPSADDLPAELALLDEAKRAVSAKDPAAALQAVAKYDARFARGSLKTDAQLIKLEALLLAGKRSEAEALGKKLSASTSSELVRERVRRLLDAK